jgi:hypothetical protein
MNGGASLIQNEYMMQLLMLSMATVGVLSGFLCLMVLAIGIDVCLQWREEQRIEIRDQQWVAEAVALHVLMEDVGTEETEETNSSSSSDSPSIRQQ